MQENHPSVYYLYASEIGGRARQARSTIYYRYRPSNAPYFLAFSAAKFHIWNAARSTTFFKLMYHL